MIKKSQYFRNCFSFDILSMRVSKVLSPFVDHWLKFVLFLISFKDDSVLVKHFALRSEIFLEFFLRVEIELLGLELYWSLGFFLSFLDFKFLLFHRFRFCLSDSLISLFLLLLFLLLLCCLRLWNFGFFSPLLDQIALFESNQTIFGVFYLKADTKSFVLGILSWGSVIPNVFVKPINLWFILNQNLNWLSSFEFYRLARWNFSSKIINHFALGFEVLWRVKSKVVIVLNEIPVKLYSVVNFLIQSVFLNFKKWTFNGSLQSTASGNWFTGVKGSWWFNLENIPNRLNEEGNSGSTSDHFNTVKLNIFGLEFISNFAKDSLDFSKNGFWDFFELLSGHSVV